ncbi:MAG: YdiU family protein [Thalassobaculaceae bacterium]|nr:YdiU family protein [Thalassobaculaceae bacterium]
MAEAALFAFENTYARLPDRFFAKLAPTPVEAPRLLLLNEGLARDLNLDPLLLGTNEGAQILSGNRIPDGAEPLAMAYAGHQFGGWVPQLGDGRAILLGEVVDRHGMRRDIQLKGSGPTPFSRMGDGRAALGPVLREYIVSEAMAAMGIATTRSLAVVTTGEAVFRERVLPGGILTRVARSHIRVGTFQFFAARRDAEGLKLLADHVIDRHYPDARDSDNPYRALLDQIVAVQAELIASWMGIGFIHGVMNTDNMSIAGDTIDYGPCAFMDTYHPGTVYSSIDHGGRYAYGNQPGIAHWNLACLAQCLLPLIDGSEDRAMDIAQEAINAFPDRYRAAHTRNFVAKLGLEQVRDGDDDLVDGLLKAMEDGAADFTLTFRRLSDLARDGGEDGPVLDLFTDPAGFGAWAERWRARLDSEARDDKARQDAMRAINPAYIPRNHQVEAALDAAVEAGSLEPLHDLRAVLQTPFTTQPGQERYELPPKPEEEVKATFCGT